MPKVTDGFADSLSSPSKSSRKDSALKVVCSLRGQWKAIYSGKNPKITDNPLSVLDFGSLCPAGSLGSYFYFLQLDCHKIVTQREAKFTNFVEWQTHKLVYRRYAGLFFTLCVDINDNELACLEAIHLFVEVTFQQVLIFLWQFFITYSPGLGSVLRKRVRARPCLQLSQGLEQVTKLPDSQSKLFLTIGLTKEVDDWCVGLVYAYVVLPPPGGCGGG